MASDEKPEKGKARAMMTMTKKINADLLTAIPHRENPPVSVRCITCHHGLPVPETLAQHLGAVLTSSGMDSVKSEYKSLREDSDRGRYDFGEQSLNDWARSLSGEGKNDDALAVLALNQEFFPKSNFIPMMQAEVHAAKGEKDIAIELLKKVVAADPENERAARRLKDLQSGGK
ncbi:MAG: photosynthetic reaction center cytochrome c subunit family protein [Candidatus Eisenbacteria bacterium]